MINDENIYEFSHAERVVIIGDVHGDIKRFKRILLEAQIINNDLEWIATPQNTIVVQVGDQVDSANRSPEIPAWEILSDINMLYFTNSLDNIARIKGGKVISLIGNHELMNVIGNFSYVSLNSNFADRHKYFMPKGTLSPILCKRPIVLKIGELFFCHAGIKRQHLQILQKHGKHVSYLNELWRTFMQTNQVNLEDKEIFDNIILDISNGILWTRNLDNDKDIDYVLEHLGCSYMFIGHTPVESINIVKGKIFYTDSGLSRAFGTTAYQYIDIQDYSIAVKQIID